MPNLSVLANIPGYGAYVAKRQINEQQEMQDLQQMGALVSLQQHFDALRKKQQLDQAMSASGGDIDKAVETLLKTGNIEAAGKLAPLVEARRRAVQGQPVGAGGLRLPSGEIIPPAERPDKPQSIGAGGLRLPSGEIIPPATRPQSPYTNVQQDPLRPGHFIGFNKDTGRMEPIQAAPGAQPQKISMDTRGEDLLSKLDQNTASIVKAVAEGRLATPTGFALKSPYWQNIMTLVGQYDPTYNAARPSVYRDFTSGPTARNITAMNTVIAHMGTMDEMVDALQNNDVVLSNRLINRLRIELGKPEVNNFDIAKQAVGNELMRVFRQVQASELETRDWEKRFSSASSPAQLKGAIKVGVNLLKGRLDAVDDQWNRAMNTDKGFPNTISPKSQAVLKKMGASLENKPTTENEQKFEEGKIYIDAKGNKAKFTGGKFIPMQ